MTDLRITEDLAEQTGYSVSSLKRIRRYLKQHGEPFTLASLKAYMARPEPRAKPDSTYQRSLRWLQAQPDLLTARSRTLRMACEAAVGAGMCDSLWYRALSRCGRSAHRDGLQARCRRWLEQHPTFVYKGPKVGTDAYNRDHPERPIARNTYRNTLLRYREELAEGEPIPWKQLVSSSRSS